MDLQTVIFVAFAVGVVSTAPMGMKNIRSKYLNFFLVFSYIQLFIKICDILVTYTYYIHVLNNTMTSYNTFNSSSDANDLCIVRIYIILPFNPK